MHKLYVDQWGNRFYAQTVKELRSQIANGKSRVRIMYVDKKDGSVMRIGYVVGQHWLREFIPNERKVA